VDLLADRGRSRNRVITARLIGVLMLVAVLVGYGSTGAPPAATVTRPLQAARPVDSSGRGSPGIAPRTVLLGRSEEGRQIVVVHAGGPRGMRVLIVVGCIHGTATSGLAHP
jgi:hypothetical protein